MKNKFFLLLILSSNLLFAQSWEPLTYDSLKSGLEINPLKGFSTIFNPDPTNNFPSTVRGKLIGLDEVMLGPNTFDWQVVDDFLDEQAAFGKHAYLQVNIDPAFGDTHIPPFLFPLVDTFFYDDPKPVGPVDDLCPDWNDPDLMDAMLTFIDSFGVKYDNDPRIFMVHLGLYGMWGEWHIGDVALVRPDLQMTEENKSLIANAYNAAFPNTLLVARFPENMPVSQDYGYSDGLFFTESISQTNNNFFHNTLKLHNADLNWKRLPIGGEIDPAVQSALWDNWPNTIGQDVLQSYDSIRPTWFFSHHHFTDQIIENSQEWENSLRANREMGYSLYVDSVRFSSNNGMPVIEANLVNEGLAPFYGNWELEFIAIDANDMEFNLGKSKWNLHLIQPDVPINYRSFYSTQALADGIYKIVMRVINPLEVYSALTPSFTFANSSHDQDIQGALSMGEMLISGGQSGVVPIPVSGISLSHVTDTLTIGETLQLTASILPVDASVQNITWVSSHPRTVAVDENGLVTTESMFGVSIISAHTQDGGFIASCEVVFKPVFVPIPSLIQAEDFIDMQGVQNNTCCGGAEILEFIDNNDWMEYGVIVSGDSIFTLDFHVSSDNLNGVIAVLDENHDTLTTRNVDTGTWWEDYQIRSTTPILLTQGEHVIRIVAETGGFNFDYVEFKSLPGTFTFLGTNSNQFDLDSNWDGGSKPPLKYPGQIIFAADCEVPSGVGFTVENMGQVIINENVVLTIN